MKAAGLWDVSFLGLVENKPNLHDAVKKGKKMMNHLIAAPLN